jgi:small GTP-binding protein
MEELKIVFVGSVDHGKSTLIGRLLYETKSLKQDKIDEIELACKELGRDVEWSFILDSLREEREQNITIDTTQIFFKTSKRNYVIIDAPGHVEFLKNMMTGASQADLAILMIDANEGIMEQTKRHSYLLSLIGVKEVIVVVNKMDLVNYSQQKFLEIENQIRNFFSKVNIKPYKIIPISAKLGLNLNQKSSEMDWASENFLEVLDNYSFKQNLHSDFIMPIQDIYKINDKRIVVGTISSGTIASGEEIVVLPKNTLTRVKSIEKFLSKEDFGIEGESIGLTTQEPVFLEPGDVICKKDNLLLKVSNSVKANLFWLAPKLNLQNQEFILRLSTQEFFVKLNIKRKFDSATLNELEFSTEININEAAEIEIISKKPIVSSSVGDCAELGRFVLELENKVVGVGIIS